MKFKFEVEYYDPIKDGLYKTYGVLKAPGYKGALEVIYKYLFDNPSEGSKYLHNIMLFKLTEIEPEAYVIEESTEEI